MIRLHAEVIRRDALIYSIQNNVPIHSLDISHKGMNLTVTMINKLRRRYESFGHLRRYTEGYSIE